MTRQDIFEWGEEKKKLVSAGQDVENLDVALATFILIVLNNKERLQEEVEASPMSKDEMLQEAETEEW